jgi:YceI-like protein
MKAKAFLVLVLITSLAVAGERARFNSASTSTITVTGSSTLHDWSMHGTAIHGAIDIAPEIAADPLRAEGWKSNTSALVTVHIPVVQIKSEHTRMNNIMLDAMKTKSYPEIRYELLEASPASGTPDSFVLKTKGKLTIAGVTRSLQMDVAAKRDGETRYIFTGDAPLKMTDFGITPPITMLGTLKTGDQVNVSFRWVVDRTD